MVEPQVSTKKNRIGAFGTRECEKTAISEQPSIFQSESTRIIRLFTTQINPTSERASNPMRLIVADTEF